MEDISLGLYTSFDLFWYFTIFSFIGWSLEVFYKYYHNKKFVNRGFLHGPFCPIYGMGIVLIFVATDILNLVPFKFNLLNISLLFLATTILTTLLEFIVGFILMKLFNQRWWDYSDLDYHIAGFISIRFSLYWGVGGSILYILLDRLQLNRGISLPRPFFEYVGILFLIYFVIDFTRSIDLAFRLKSFTKDVSAAGQELRSRVEKADISLDLPDIKDFIHNNKLDQLLDEISEDLEEVKQDTKIFINKAINRYDSLLSKKRVNQFRHFIEAFPNIRNVDNESIFEILRNRLDLPVIKISVSKREKKEVLVGNINDSKQTIFRKGFKNARAHLIISNREAWPNLSMKMIEIEKNGSIENRDHQNSHLYILVNGNLTAKTKEDQYLMESNDFIYFPKGAYHKIENTNSNKVKLVDIVPNEK